MKTQMLVAIAVLLVSTGAAAEVTNAIPEPGVLELLAIGGVVAMAAAIRKRRK